MAAGHPLAAPVAEFLDDLADTGRSACTVRGYRADLAQFAAYDGGGVRAIDSAVLRGFFGSIGRQAKATPSPQAGGHRLVLG